MQYRAATTGDLANVFRRNDKRMTDEYRAAGFNPRAVKDIFREAVLSGRAHTLLQDGDPLALIVWQESDGSLETGFAAKPEFFCRKYVRFCRGHIRRIQEENGNLSIIATSYAVHPHTKRWFAALGFEQGPTQEKATLYGLGPR